LNIQFGLADLLRHVPRSLRLATRGQGIMRSRLKRSPWLALISFTPTVATGVLASCGVASGQASYTTYSVVHVFSDTERGPDHLIQASDGNFYGTAGEYQPGSIRDFHVFKMNAAGTVNLVHSFPCARPQSLIQAADGNFYGTQGSLASGCGTGGGNIFKMTADGSVTTLHPFSPNLLTAVSRLIQASDGTFYGTADHGGADPDTGPNGSVFKMTSDGTFTVLHLFDGATEGSNPSGAALVQAADRALYGITSAGGTGGGGSVFRITSDGAFTVLHQFAGGAMDGATPVAALIQAADGNLYGTTYSGGTANAGTIFKMTTAGTITLLYSFAGGTADGATPTAALIQAGDGTFYGTTASGGAANAGTLFRMTAHSAVSIVHAFTGGDDAAPNGLIRASDGNLYGTTQSIFAPYPGEIFQLILTPPANISLAADFDGDGKADLVVYRPTTGEWFVRFSSSNYSYANDGTYQWGLPGDIPLVADIDGDGKADLVVWRPSNGTWYVRLSSSNYSYATWTSYQWGLPGDVPVPADFDGDGRTDLVVYRPSNGTWYVLFSSSNYSYQTWTSYQWGLPGDVPTAADLDGDHKADLVVWRPSTGTWYVRFSSSSYSYANWTSYQWGLPGDIPLVADVDGDGKTDLAVWRPSNGTWYVLFSSSNYSYETFRAYQWGLPGDMPVPGDFDGDHKTDLVVWRPSSGTWYVEYLSSIPPSGGYGSWNFYQWGLFGDIPL
jgi:uncharacterized repeat protein (TIGR03803 family)